MSEEVEKTYKLVKGGYTEIHDNRFNRVYKFVEGEKFTTDDTSLQYELDGNNRFELLGEKKPRAKKVEVEIESEELDLVEKEIISLDLSKFKRKKTLDDYAKAEYDIDLDRRKSLKSMKEQFERLLEEKER